MARRRELAWRQCGALSFRWAGCTLFAGQKPSVRIGLPDVEPATAYARVCHGESLRTGGNYHGGLFSITRENANGRRRPARPAHDPGRACDGSVRSSWRPALVGVLHAVVARAQWRDVDRVVVVFQLCADPDH